MKTQSSEQMVTVETWDRTGNNRSRFTVPAEDCNLHTLAFDRANGIIFGWSVTPAVDGTWVREDFADGHHEWLLMPEDEA